MSIQPDALHRAGTPSVSPCSSVSRRCTLLLPALALSLSALFAASAHADQASDILKKMEGVYSGAKTFVGSVTVKQSGKTKEGKPASVTRTQQISYKSPNLIRVQMTMSATGAAAKAGNQNAMIVSDGKTLYRYSSTQKQYSKSPAPPAIPLNQLFGIALPSGSTPGASLLSPTNVMGHQAYVVQIKQQVPQPPPSMSAADKAKYDAYVKQMKPVQVVIDKKDYHLLQIRQSMGTNTAVVEFGPHTVNGAVADSAFKFSPPAGSKEITMPQPPPGGGAMPGNPGGVPRRP